MSKPQIQKRHIARNIDPRKEKAAQQLLEASGIMSAPKDMVAHPAHYNRGGIECMQVSAAMVTGWSPQAAYRLGQAHDYIFRHAHKGEPIQDLEKAVFWIQQHIADLKAQEATHG